ncbi:MAG: macro domain-containing protein [Lachnospiraceae bacterium]|nr:macro domain-containing protein [Lachnospiraceae bacterium]
MPLKIIRNDITKMNTEAIVNTANSKPLVGTGCDYAVYMAAGYDELLEFRTKNIGEVKEGDVFITPGFHLPVKYIIHAVSPKYMEDDEESENLLRSCYEKCLNLAKENNIKSISFPLISTGSFGYPKEEGLRIALEEISKFLMSNEMDVTIVVFDSLVTELYKKISDDLDSYIDDNYVESRTKYEYSLSDACADMKLGAPRNERRREARNSFKLNFGARTKESEPLMAFEEECEESVPEMMADSDYYDSAALENRLKHLSDTFSEYLIYLIDEKDLKYSAVYKAALIDKRLFSKIKNNKNYHPDKLTALCLCVGARLNLDQAKDLLKRAGYALSPSDLTDVIFEFFIENEIYDMIELDIQLEEHGLPCIIQ